ncbi:DUF4352 domain-containing protein [Paenibacillus larvae]|uniref:DUF4352 domain-containing protein n=3 Tax=root TaxID=1 RepID=V9W9N8_9BACL|nr:DUF4352 domain-containing protein [Paenibacillus larvae]AHD06415.1 hypothetical protein ERIC2_c26280 [Paenibacillus larvae subsp. larvae DSM 25430]QHZ51216.1 Telomeric repeat-binding factor 2 [Paenibacillus larvae subsp. larvae]AVG12962.1 Telomeric repeat-binding factor 2 [Paenibacillus larvae subsp. larvae DSM 25430]ETK27949.1 hypothetical protein ERIC1_1c14040 [Paenibacillus larvae subsp. larvae DSM 25719]MDR5596684.1 DUF4352 domain-containing protein [Paenibacillus larvae]
MVLCVFLGVWLIKGSGEIKDSDYIVQYGPGSRVYKKGESVKLNGEYGITAHSVKKVESDVFFPHTGKKINVSEDQKVIKVKMTLKNFSTKLHAIQPLIQYEIMEGEYPYKSALSATDGFTKYVINPNETIEGSLVFVVPKNLHKYTLIFKPDPSENDSLVKFKL